MHTTVGDAKFYAQDKVNIQRICFRQKTICPVCVCACARTCVCDFGWAEIMCFKLGLAGIHVVKKSNNIGGKFSKHLKIS